VCQTLPGNATCLYGKGVCCAAMGRHSDAVAAFLASLAVNDRDARTHLALAAALQALHSAIGGADRLRDARKHYM
jgi:hypothetical protein